MMTKTSPSLEAELQQLTARALSPLSRYGHVALLLAALLMSVLIAALLATESTLPPRTHVAFAVMLAIGISWVAYAAWVLTQRRPLMAMHRVIAGWMAVAFTTLFVLGAGAVAVVSGETAAFAALGTGVAMLLAAVGVLRAARARFAALTQRRQELERALREVR
jgi:hypothetical protein